MRSSYNKYANDDEMRSFAQRLLLSAAVQGVVFGVGIYMMGRIINGTTPGRTVVIRGKRIALTGSELTLVECITDPNDVDVDLTRVGGLDSAKKVLKESVVAPLRHPELFPSGSLRSPPKGVLLQGPPGTGKTLLAKAVAKTCDAAFLEVKVESLFGKWLGESEQAVAAIFSLAKKIQPCVVFVDELDSLLSHRSGTDTHAYANAKTIFLRHWDGFSTNEVRHRIVVIGATNCPETLDIAVLRRLSVKIDVPYPTAEERRQILSILLRGEDASEVDVSGVATAAERYSGADLKELCQHACRVRVMESISQAEVDAMNSSVAEARREEEGGGATWLSGFFGFGHTAAAPPPPPAVAQASPPAPLTTQLFFDCMDIIRANQPSKHPKGPLLD